MTSPRMWVVLLCAVLLTGFNLGSGCLTPVATDTDGDGVADATDNCPNDANADQADADGNGVGDVCDQPAPDADGDGVADATDNCPNDANADQADADSDGVGDACDQPAGFKSADVARGGALYDEFWKVDGTSATEPTDDHPLWASRPDTTSDTATGSATWRCKECHGWDYKGKDGVYATGSHATGFAGIFGTTKSAQEVFDLVKTDHTYGSAGLSDADIWDVAKFVLEGQIDTDTIIDSSGAFTGDVANGQTLFENGIGTNLACAVCHGADGSQIVLDDEPTVGAHAVANAWEIQHKVRFGEPGTPMPAATNVNASLSDVGDVGAYAQTLPQETP